MIDKTRGRPSPPFLIIAPNDAPIRNKKMHAKTRLYLSFIVSL